MGPIRYATYAPAERGLPWLAVVLIGGKVVDTFPCPSEDAAKHVLREMHARYAGKNGSAHV
jgi:hypothetical protein